MTTKGNNPADAELIVGPAPAHQDPATGAQGVRIEGEDVRDEVPEATPELEAQERQMFQRIGLVYQAPKQKLRRNRAVGGGSQEGGFTVPPEHVLPPVTLRSPGTQDAEGVCRRCRSVTLSGLNFCIECGSDQVFQGTCDEYLIRVHHFPNPTVQRIFMEWLAQSQGPAGGVATRSTVRQGLYLWLTEMTRAEAERIREGMESHGITAEVIPMDGHGGLWASNLVPLAWASRHRRNALLAGIAAFLGATVMFSPGWLLAAPAAALIWWIRQHQWASQQLRVRADRLAAQLAGWGQINLLSLQELIAGIRDGDVQSALRTCAREFQEICSSLRSIEATHGRIASDIHRSLQRLVQQGIAGCERYLDVERYLVNSRPGALEEQLAELQLRRARKADPSLQLQAAALEGQLKRQVEIHQTIVEKQQHLKTQMVGLAATIQNLRAQVLNTLLTTQASNAGEVPGEATGSMGELNASILALEATLLEMQASER